MCCGEFADKYRIVNNLSGFGPDDSGHGMLGHHGMQSRFEVVQIVPREVLHIAATVMCKFFQFSRIQTWRELLRSTFKMIA